MLVTLRTTVIRSAQVLQLLCLHKYFTHLLTGAIPTRNLCSWVRVTSCSHSSVADMMTPSHPCSSGGPQCDGVRQRQKRRVENMKQFMSDSVNI